LRTVLVCKTESLHIAMFYGFVDPMSLVVRGGVPFCFTSLTHFLFQIESSLNENISVLVIAKLAII